MRVCRLSLAFPRVGGGGAGLHPYHLSVLSSAPTLHLTMAAPGEPHPLPEHVRLVELRYRRFPGTATRHAFLAPLAAPGKLLEARGLREAAWPHLAEFRPDVVHCHTVTGIPLGLRARRAGALLALSLHGSEFVSLERLGLARAVLSRCDLVFPVTQEMLGRAQRHAPQSRVVYTPNGVDAEVFSPGPTDCRRDELLFVGRLIWQKGLPSLLDAFRRVRQEVPHVRLRLLGDGPDRGQLEALAASQGVAEAVEFAGAVSHTEVAAAMQQARVFVLASVSEGSPKVLIEALASGMPVVTTDVGECREIVGDAGIVVPPSDPAALGEALLTVLRDEERRGRLAAQARPMALRRSWQGTADRVQQAMEEALGGRARTEDDGPASELCGWTSTG